MTWEEWVVRMMDRTLKWTVRHPRKAEENRAREAAFRLALMRGTPEERCPGGVSTLGS